MPEMTPRRPRTALITGASSGIGAAFARHLAAAGHRLVLVARSTDRLGAARAGLIELGAPQVDVLGADLTDAAEAARVGQRLASTDDPVDLLVNNAGTGLGQDFLDCSPAELTTQIALNTTAVVLLTRAALPAMIARGHGGVINVASIAGLLPGRGTTYPGSKAFVISFTEGLAASLEGTGVRVQALCPGFVRTEFHRRAGIDMTKVPGPAYVDVDQLVQRSLADLRVNRVLSVPGALYKGVAVFADFAPRALVNRLAARVANRGRT